MVGWLRRLRARIRYRRFDAELRREIDSHRSMIEDDLGKQGRSSNEARAEAARTLGNVTLEREEARGVWLAPWVESVGQDLRYAVRSLSRSPAFTVTVLVTMTIGIALSTAQFSAFNTVLLKPWPVENRKDLLVAAVSGQNGSRGLAFSPGDLETLETRSQTIAAAALFERQFARLTQDPGVSGSLIEFQYVTPGFFEATGVRFQLGRNFRPEENRAGAANVAIISHRLWQREFGGAADVIGRPVYFLSAKLPLTVVGVTREGWRGPVPYSFEAWLPVEAKRLQFPKDAAFAAGGNEARARCCLSLIVRPRADASPSQVQDEMSSLLRGVSSAPADQNRRVVVSDTRQISNPQAARLLPFVVLALVAGTVIVLIVTGANVAHLQLARAMSRRKEIQTRLALGAGRARIIRQLVTEALLLSVVAAAIGLVVVYNLRSLLVHISEINDPEAWTPDVRVFLYSFGLAALTSVVFGLTPALRTTKVSLVAGSGQSATPPGRLRFNTALLSLQIAVSAAALTGASLMTRAVSNVTTADHIGFEADGVTLFMIGRPETANSAGRPPAYAQAFVQALSASSLPSLGLADVPPFLGDRFINIHRIDRPDVGNAANIAPMSAQTFAVLGIPIVEGRALSDRPGDAEAVVNERLARTLWPGERALGQRLTAKGQFITDSNSTFTVVGVTKDVHYGSESSLMPLLHVALTSPMTEARYPYVLVRGTGPVIADRIKSILAGVDPGATVTTRLLTENIETRLTDYKMGVQLAWAGGTLALALSAFGLFGIFAYVVEERRREIGIRVALGAENAQVLRMLFGTTRRATLIGLGGGFLISLGIGPLMGTFLYGLSPFDPIAFAAVAAILAVTGFLATAIPARRALSVDPAVTLRQDT